MSLDTQAYTKSFSNLWSKKSEGCKCATWRGAWASLWFAKLSKIICYWSHLTRRQHRLGDTHILSKISFVDGASKQIMGRFMQKTGTSTTICVCEPRSCKTEVIKMSLGTHAYAKSFSNLWSEHLTKDFWRTEKNLGGFFYWFWLILLAS